MIKSDVDLEQFSRFANMGRRALLGGGVGLGTIAAAELLGIAGARGQGASPKDKAEAPAFQPDKGAIATGQFAPKAKRIIAIHQMGAPSQVDTFDYKPTLIKMHGQELPASVKGNARVSAMSNSQSAFTVLKPIAEFRQYGQSGRWVSDLMPYTGQIADDLTFIYTMHTEHVNHDPASVFIHTGFQLPGRPSAGAWVNYGLGTDNANLPSFVVMKSQGLGGGVAANVNMWSAGFLPSHHQGVEFRPGADPVLHVSNPDGLSKEWRRQQLDAIDEMSKTQYGLSRDPEILSKIAQYEMAYRMQGSVPEVADIASEPSSVLDMYGPDVHQPGSFARNCLLARRLIERDVKFVQLIHVGWDNHARIAQLHPPECKGVDQPAAALVADLKQRGLLDDTLVTWGGEFGRTSYAQGGINENSGRDHHGGNFTMWMAGAGLKPGIAYGKTDDFSYNVVENPVTLHDLHATILYLMGIDHTRLTFHYQGRDFRLTDVSGVPITAILA